MSGDNILEIDGGVLEGGGQILRMATAFSALLSRPIKIRNIRAGRNNPGLRAQHQAGLLLVRDLCNGRLEGANIGSTAVDFYPGKLTCGNYLADTKTAGSVGLLFQVALPCLLHTPGVSHLRLKGGTNADMAPPIEFTQLVFQPVAQNFNFTINMDVVKKGFFPKGGGDVKVVVNPTDGLRAVTMLERGDVRSITGYSYVAGVLPIKMAHTMADVSVDLLKAKYERAEMDIKRFKDGSDRAVGNGSGIIIVAETTTGCLLAGSALGKRDTRAEDVGKEAANMLIDSLSHGGCVDDHLQDQLIIFMALATGKSSIKTGPITLHTRTAIHVAELLTQARFSVIEDAGTRTVVITCDGMGLQNKM